MDTLSLGKVAAVGLVALGVLGCAGGDNPTALSDLNPNVQFQIDATELETFEEIEVEVMLMEGGSPMDMREVWLEIESEAGGEVSRVAMHPEGDVFSAHVTFYEPGGYHLHVRGTLKLHHLEFEMGDQEIEVGRRHEVIGPYWVEFAASPAPVEEGDSGHLHLFTYQLNQDGTPGAAVGGLTLAVEVHDPAGVETTLGLIEEDVGEYEGAYDFGEAGHYEVHVSIDVDGAVSSGEFELPVLAPESEDGGQPEDGGGHGH